MKISYMANPRLDNKDELIKEIELSGNVIKDNYINEIALASKVLSMRLLLVLLNCSNGKFLEIINSTINKLDNFHTENAENLIDKQTNFIINEHKQQLLTMAKRIKNLVEKNTLASITSELNLFTVTLYQAFKEINKTDAFANITVKINDYSAKTNLIFKFMENIKNKCLRLLKGGIS